MRSDTSEPEILEKIYSRESLLAVNAQLIAQLQKRVNVTRFRAQESDSLRLGYVRALIQALQSYNTILKDVELDAIQQELEEVKELVQSQGSIQGQR